MELNSKQKWVVDRLRRDGWSIYRNDLPAEYYLHKNLEHYYSTQVFFAINNMGYRMEFRPRANSAMHLHYYLGYNLGVKNWNKIKEVFNYFRFVDANIGPLIPPQY